MKAGFLQYSVVFGDPEANKRKVNSLIGSDKFDLLVLPELALTGYFMSSRREAMKAAETLDASPSIAFFRSIAEEHEGAVVFGFPERVGDKVYNAAAMVCPDGKTCLYRKTHLFDREKEWFDPGDTGFHVFDYRGVKIGIMICFDWIFPESARTLMLKGAEILCHPSNLVLPHCQDAMVTRSLENRLFAITCNRIGNEHRGDIELSFTGRSQITGCKGEILARAGADTEEMIYVEIDPALAHDKRVTPHNEILTDRREEMYS